MKKLMVLSLLLCGFVTANAQVSFSINIGSQPAWGPTGYDHVDYYYLPDADAYYDINSRVFVYYDGGNWRRGSSLPGRYSNMDLYHAHKVVINQRDPWLHNDRYHKQYGSYVGRHDQVAIRDARDQKYWQNPGHPQYNTWRQQHGNGHDNGNHYGNDKHDNNDHNNGNRGNGNNGRGNNGNGNGNGNGHGRGR